MSDIHSMPTRPPPRITFKVAMEARTAVVFRKGPSRHVQMLCWNLETDEVTPGQWLIGNVEDANVSPDGKLVVYYARKGGKCFTAVSRPPYFTALAFWPDPGWWPPIRGGFFPENRRLILGARYPGDYDPGPVPKDFEIGDVWTHLLNGKPFKGWDGIVLPPEAVAGWLDERPLFRKPNPKESALSLERAWAHKTGATFRLVGTSGPEDLVGMGCVDWDHDGSLLFARDGALYRQNVRAKGKAPVLVEDLSDNTFEEVIAPPSMKAWPVWNPRRSRRQT